MARAPRRPRAPLTLLLVATLAAAASLAVASAFAPHPPRRLPLAAVGSSSSRSRRHVVQPKPVAAAAESEAWQRHQFKGPGAGSEDKRQSRLRLARVRGGGPDPSRAWQALRQSAAGFLRHLVAKHFLIAGAFVSILLAALNPSIGRVGGPLKPEFTVNVIGVSLIFLLSGLSLRVDQLASAAKDLKLNFATQAFNLGFGPLLGLAFQPILCFFAIDPRLATGLLIVSCLPTTVNMCIVLSQAAGANLATAVFNAVLSNALGVFIAPATIFAVVGAAAVSVPYLSVIQKLVYKVVFPVALGVGLRAKFAAVRSRVESPGAKLPLKLLTESILISIIYTTFCQSFLAGLAVTGRDLVGLAVAVPAFHVISLALMFAVARTVTAKRDEQIAAMFVGSQKTLAFGMPLIKTIFEKSPSAAYYAAPILFIHPSQLVIGSLLVPFLIKYIEDGRKAPSSSAAAAA